MAVHRLWAGVVLIVAAVVSRSLLPDSWWMALLFVLGMILIVSSFNEREVAR